MTAMHRHTTASGSVGAGGSGCVLGGLADGLDRRARRGHARQQVARREAEVDDDGAGVGRLLSAGGVAGDHGTHASGVVALEPDELRTDGHDGLRQVDAGGAESLGGARRQQPIEVVAGHDRLDLGGTGRDDDPLGLDVEHAGRCPGHDRGTRVDGDDLVPLPRVQDERVRMVRGGSPAAVAATDDDDLGLRALDRDVRAERCRDRVRAVHHGECRVAVRRMPLHARARSGRHLAGAHERDAIDDAQAVPAVAGQAQRAATGRGLTRAHERDRHGVARLEGHGPHHRRRSARSAPEPDAVGHWRIRAPVGSNIGSGCSRAGRRRPMISISKPSPPGPSGVASAAGT